MSRETLIRNLLVGLVAAAAAACSRDAADVASDGGADAIGGDGGDGSTGPYTATANPQDPSTVATPVDEPDAGVPGETGTSENAYYISRTAVPSGGASGNVYTSSSGSVSALPFTDFRVNSVFRTHGSSPTSNGRLCELATSGGADVDYNSYVRCFEENEEGVMEPTWDDRGDGTASGSIVGGKMLLGRNAGIRDMAIRSFDDGDWGYFPLNGLGEVLSLNLENAEEIYIPVVDSGCMSPVATLEVDETIYTLAESADGTGRVCAINPSLDEIDQSGEVPLTTSRPKTGAKVGHQILIASPGSLEDFNAPGSRGVELFNTETRSSVGVLWDTTALCAGIETCVAAYPLHLSVSEELGMGAVTMVSPNGDTTNYYVRTFTLPADETGTFELGGVVYSRSRVPGTPDGIEGTAFMNGSTLFITHRNGSAEYDIETGEVAEVSTVGADGRFPSQAPVVLAASGDEE